MNKNKVEIKFPKAHSQKQFDIMTAFEKLHVTEIWISCGSKFGKSIAASVNISNVALTRRNAMLRWIAPIYQQSIIGMRYMQKLLPSRPHTEVVLSPPQIRFPYTGSIIQFWHGQDPESLEGEATHGNILDECSKMKEQVYDSTKTTTTVTRGKIMAISTPRGRNWFWRKCMEAKDEMERAKFENRNPTKIFITASTLDNPFVTKEAIDEARRTLPARLFRQYILAEFVDDAEVFIGYRDCINGNPIEHFGKSERWLDDNANQSTVVIGADWAKTQDYTVFTAIDYTSTPMRVVGYYRFQGIDYKLAIKELVKFASKFKHVELIMHDKTGIGAVIHDMLDKAALPYEGFLFTNESKNRIVNKLMLAFQNRQIIIPHWQTLINELDSFEVSSNELGRMRYNAPAGQHDDTVCSLMLAYHAASQLIDSNNFEATEITPIKDSELPPWYLAHDNEEDDDW